MSTEVIELICEKLGTTIEKLVPSVIEYCLFKLHIANFILIPLFILSVAAFYIGCTKWAYNNDSCVVFWIIGGIGAVLAFVFICINFYDIRIWHTYPTMKAYETILSWAAKAS